MRMRGIVYAACRENSLSWHVDRTGCLRRMNFVAAWMPPECFDDRDSGIRTRELETQDVIGFRWFPGGLLARKGKQFERVLGEEKVKRGSLTKIRAQSEVGLALLHDVGMHGTSFVGRNAHAGCAREFVEQIARRNAHVRTYVLRASKADEGVIRAQRQP